MKEKWKMPLMIWKLMKADQDGCYPLKARLFSQEYVDKNPVMFQHKLKKMEEEKKIESSMFCIIEFMFY